MRKQVAHKRAESQEIPTQIEWLAVFRCQMRGRRVDIEYSEGAAASKPRRIRDTVTNEVLRWKLTKEEIAALRAVLTAP
jgi:hypothetical protein